ncbi:MAG TPA: ATP synthase subunit I [Pyrinomonadaceae bacterium]|nr:ATP synthase subunit I [Pyrinomonadaceae bacterium]
MNEIANNVTSDVFANDGDGALETRIFRSMVAIVTLAVIASAMLAPWRVTAGLTLGGALSILNYHWLRTSIEAVLSNATEKRPRVKLSRYIFRYFVVGAVVFAAYKLQIVSLPATIAGLCAFVPALFVEAFRQFYSAIIHREGTY